MQDPFNIRRPPNPRDARTFEFNFDARPQQLPRGNNFFNHNQRDAEMHDDQQLEQDRQLQREELQARTVAQNMDPQNNLFREVQWINQFGGGNNNGTENANNTAANDAEANQEMRENEPNIGNGGNGQVTGNQ